MKKDIVDNSKQASQATEQTVKVTDINELIKGVNKWIVQTNEKFGRFKEYCKHTECYAHLCK
jgi:wobble nucleotide-excising tRNase